MFKRMFQMFQMFFRPMLQVFHLNVVKIDLDVAYVALVIHACFKSIFQEHVSSVSSISERMLQMFYLNVANSYVASICSECFICFRGML